jgi:hypothetical protein
MGDLQGEPHYLGSREFVHCVEGSVRCGPDGDLLDLGPGDTAYFDGNVPHTYAGGPEGGRAMLVMSYPINAQGTGHSPSGELLPYLHACQHGDTGSYGRGSRLLSP